VLGLGLGYMTLLVLEQVLKTLGHSHSHGHGHAHSAHAGMKKAKSDEDDDEDDHLLDLELSAAVSGNGLGGGAVLSSSGGGGGGGGAGGSSGVSLSESHQMSLSASQNSIGRVHKHNGSSHNSGAKPAAVSEAFSLIAFVGLGVHSLVDGLLIAAGMEASAQIGTRVALAIILHKFPDGFVMSSVIASSSSPASSPSSSSASSLSSSAVSSSSSSGSGSSSASSLSRHDPNQTVCGFTYQSCAWMLGIASMTPLGALIGSLLLGLLPASSLGFTMGYGAGTFLFITCSAIVPELFHGAASLRSALTGLLSMAAGYCIFLAIESLSEHHH
jgi:zinc transporter ZupT